MSHILDPQRSHSVELREEEILRYSRHLLLPEVTLEGQKKLKAARVLCVGMGGLGSPIALYLAAAGVGCLGLIDSDVVDYPNLQRQILYGTKDIGQKKINCARARLQDVNPHVEVILHDCFFCSSNALEITKNYDIVIDGTDNLPARYLSNDVCVFLKKPNIYGAIFRFEGQSTILAPHLGGPCYRCLFPEPPPPGTIPTCAEGGILGALPGIIGTIQALECIKLIIGAGAPLIGRMMHFDALKMKFRELQIRQDPECPVCSQHPTITKLIDYDQFCGIPQTHMEKETESPLCEVTVEELKAKLDSGLPMTLLDVRESHEYEIARIPTAHLIPLGELPSRMNELNPSNEIYIHCKTGGRSANAVRQLQKAGFTKLFNVKGGISAWSEKIDSSVPKY